MRPQEVNILRKLEEIEADIVVALSQASDREPVPELPIKLDEEFSPFSPRADVTDSEWIFSETWFHIVGRAKGRVSLVTPLRYKTHLEKLRGKFPYNPNILRELAELEEVIDSDKFILRVDLMLADPFGSETDLKCYAEVDGERIVAPNVDSSSIITFNKWSRNLGYGQDFQLVDRDTDIIRGIKLRLSFT